MKKYSGLFILLLIISCEPEKTNNFQFSFDKVSGFVQKGPFLNGTSITISELSEDFSPTGRTFNSQILDNSGSFEIYDIKFASGYVELKADGYYYNEVDNSNSASQLTLFALSDLRDKTDLNVNILSHLEKSRVMYLIHDGLTFEQAKKQAQQEILSIFEIEKQDIAESELLDISKQGEDNGILLAVSVILQGYLPVQDLSELLANISTDIREDGVLNSHTLGTTLINNARNLHPDEIRTNLENRFETLGMAVTIPDFESHVLNFIDNTDFEYTDFITYPGTGIHGLNILDTLNTINTEGYYSMKAVIPEGSNLKVKIAGARWYFPIFQENTGWTYSDWNALESSRIFTSTRTGEIDFKILLEKNNYTIVCDSITMECDSVIGDSASTEIYVFENNSLTPTWTRNIVIE